MTKMSWIKAITAARPNATPWNRIHRYIMMHDPTGHQGDDGQAAWSAATAPPILLEEGKIGLGGQVRLQGPPRAPWPSAAPAWSGDPTVCGGRVASAGRPRYLPGERRDRCPAPRSPTGSTLRRPPAVRALNAKSDSAPPRTALGGRPRAGSRRGGLSAAAPDGAAFGGRLAATAARPAWPADEFSVVAGALQALSVVARGSRLQVSRRGLGRRHRPGDAATGRARQTPAPRASASRCATGLLVGLGRFLRPGPRLAAPVFRPQPARAAAADHLRSVKVTVLCASLLPNTRCERLSFRTDCPPSTC